MDQNQRKLLLNLGNFFFEKDIRDYKTKLYC